MNVKFQIGRSKCQVRVGGEGTLDPLLSHHNYFAMQIIRIMPIEREKRVEEKRMPSGSQSSISSKWQNINVGETYRIDLLQTKYLS